MHFRESLPEINRLSIVSAAIMLAFALTQLIAFPAQLFSFAFFGILLEFNLNFSTITTLLTAMLAAAGMDWLIQSHPDKHLYSNRWAFIRHWILPVLTTFVIGIALNTFAGSPFWWVAFVLGSFLLMAVLIAEYNVVGANEDHYPLARIGLTGLSFALYLLLAIAIYSANLRLYIRLPLLGIGALMVISRSLYLRLGKWEILWSIVSSLVVTEIVVGFHYFPLSPTQFGLSLVGVAYGLTSFVTGIKENRKGTAFWGEPVVMLALMILVSILWP